jgi:hypothetical protein
MSSVSTRRAQELFLDGIEYSIQMAECAYERLRANAARHLPDRGEDCPSLELLFLDAWSVIDCSKRLRALVDQALGLKKTPAVKSFLKATEAIAAFRNYYQHLETEAVGIATTGWPIWGALSWVKILEPATEGNGRLLSTRTVIPGRLASVAIPMMNPLGKDIASPTDHFVLSIADATINLSDLMASIRLFNVRYAVAVRKGAELTGIAEGAPIPIVIDVNV